MACDSYVYLGDEAIAQRAFRLRLIDLIGESANIFSGTFIAAMILTL